MHSLVTALAFIGPLVQASDSTLSKDYEVTTETVMPHLEEALRYATTQERRCLNPQELASVFPILRHDSLKGCRLEEQNRRDDAVSYLLICEGGNGTTGSALWQLGENQLTGRLDVKLGGKNMTFYQRVTAKPLGGCTSEVK
jgi:hypothetical protein